MDDSLDAFCKHTHVALPGSGSGPLAGLTFATKDVFDIEGHRTGNGNPTWLETHPPARRTASAVQKLLDAGAAMTGKTHTDDMAYSLNGENVHYGTPKNPIVPDRIPGGSSSGSAAAVAGGLVDFALGSDCGGSIRLPASYCAIHGIRTSHGLVPADGVVPLASSFDTVGWFARDAAMMARVGDVLLPPAPAFTPKRVLIASQSFAAMGTDVRDALADGVAAVKSLVGETEDAAVYDADPSEWSGLFRVLQGDEIRAQHGAWIDRCKPTFGPGVRERFEWTRTINPDDVAKAKLRREIVARHMDELLGDDTILCLPSAPGPAPKLQTPGQELEPFRAKAFILLSIAGLARLPQVSLPLGTLDGCPIGLSLIGPRGCDRGLLAWIAANERALHARA